jgi:peptidoglycan hydrolase-like protein with peptidoglycan-binding domain
MTSATRKALIAAGIVCCFAVPASAQRHVALVLDNGGTHATSPISHAAQIAANLRSMRYQVIYGQQQNKAGMRKYINDFRSQLTDADVALFYFKGVTLDSRGRNLLIASDAQAGQDIGQSIELDEIADYMKARRANVLLVDAGLAGNTAQALANANDGLSPSMARMRDRSGFMVAFAHMPGKLTRSDAESPFAELLASYLTSGDLTSADLGRKLRQDVFERTRGSQLPWISNNLGAVQLAALPAALPVVPPPRLPEVQAAPPFDRAGFVIAVQQQLTRHRCYSGAIDGDAGPQTDAALDALGRTRIGGAGPALKLASADRGEFQNWLEWSERQRQPVCPPPIVEQRRRPVPTPRVTRRETAPPVKRFEQPRHRSEPRSRPSSGGSFGGGNPFAPTR